MEGSLCRLYVGALEVASINDRIAPELLSVFTDDMYHSRSASAADYFEEPGDTLTVNEFAARGQVIADRLDILGLTPARAREILDAALDDAQPRRDDHHAPPVSQHVGGYGAGGGGGWEPFVWCISTVMTCCLGYRWVGPGLVDGRVILAGPARRRYS